MSIPAGVPAVGLGAFIVTASPVYRRTAVDLASLVVGKRGPNVDVVEPTGARILDSRVS